MTIFQLAFFVCTTIQPTLGSDRYSKECEWQPAGLYASEGRCGVEGSQQHGKPVHRFSHVIGSTVLVESHRCTSVSVTE